MTVCMHAVHNWTSEQSTQRTTQHLTQFLTLFNCRVTLYLPLHTGCRLPPAARLSMGYETARGGRLVHSSLKSRGWKRPHTNNSTKDGLFTTTPSAAARPADEEDHHDHDIAQDEDDALGLFSAFSQMESLTLEKNMTSLQEWTQELQSWWHTQQQQPPPSSSSMLASSSSSSLLEAISIGENIATTARDASSRCKKRPIVSLSSSDNNNLNKVNLLPLRRIGPFASNNNNVDNDTPLRNKKQRHDRTQHESKNNNTDAFAAGLCFGTLESDEQSTHYWTLQQQSGSSSLYHHHRAFLSCLVQWTRIRACRTIRRRRRQRQTIINNNDESLSQSQALKEAGNDTNANHEQNNSNSFKERSPWDEFVLDSNVVCSGDYRVDTTTATTNSMPSSSIKPPMPNCCLGEEELNATWTAVAACAEIVLQQLKANNNNNSTAREKKGQEQSPPPPTTTIYLSALFAFLFQTSRLPPPTKSAAFPVAKRRQLDDVLSEIIGLCATARQFQARLWDLWGEEGVDLESIRKELDCTVSTSSSCSGGVKLDEEDEMQRQVEQVAQWQDRLDDALNLCNTMDEAHPDRNDLLLLEQLIAEGRQHGFRSKSLVALEEKVERAYGLQDRILQWKVASSVTKETIKFVAALVRDIHRLKIRFPVVNAMLTVHHEAEAWIERANIAIRSRISLDEIKTLLQRGLEMPVDLKEFLEKLQSRVTLAKEWMDGFTQVVPVACTGENAIDKMKLILQTREALSKSSWHYSQLFELATAGSRIPVDINFVKMLHIELDARAWSLKAKKWIPDPSVEEGNRKGKLEDLREHLTKAVALRDRLSLSALEKAQWILEGESQLSVIVKASDDWIEKYQFMLEDESDEAYSIQQLQKIVEDGLAINANLGMGVTKFSRILSQAETWYKVHYPLFVRCKLRGTADPNTYVDLRELHAATNEGFTDIALALKEVDELKNLEKTIESWHHRASLASGQKRQVKGKTMFFSYADLISLIEEAESLPINLSAEVGGLEEQCRLIKEWEQRAEEDLEGIRMGFLSLRESINDTYGPATSFQRERLTEAESVKGKDSDDMAVADQREGNGTALSESMQSEEMMMTSDEYASNCDGTISTVSSEQESNPSTIVDAGSGASNVCSLIKSFCKDSVISPCICTLETKMGAELKAVSRWCVLSLKYVGNQRYVFDKRSFVAFDRCVSEGKSLLEPSEENGGSIPMDRVRCEWAILVSDQLARLTVLQNDRHEFISWCKKTESILQSSERRPSLEQLKDLAETSREYPVVCDVIVKVRKITAEGMSWLKTARSALASTTRMSLQDAKTLLDKGDELMFSCDELKTLRNGLKSARGWSNRVKRCKIDREGAKDSQIQQLIDEHECLLIDMSDEVTKLQGAVTNYCLCRQPYDGFMIACDECEDWFHGPCVGVSESRADRVNKFVCLRCSLSKTHKASASTCVDVIRKWVSKKDLKKARQIESQKHKRRVRKEKKDISKHQEECLLLHQHLVNIAERENNCHVTILGCISCNDDSRYECSIDSKQMPQIIVASDGSHQSNEGHVSSGTIEYARSHESSSTEIQVSSATSNPEESFKDEESTRIQTDSFKDVNVEGQNVNRDGIETVVSDTLNKEDTLAMISKLEALIQSCCERLKDLVVSSAKLKEIEDREDKMACMLRSWVLRVRTHVLVPSAVEMGRVSMPKRDGSFSDAMIAIESEAEKLGICEFRDVQVVLNSFKCMSWCLNAIRVLMRQPTSPEIVSIVDSSSTIEFPDEKALRYIKALAQRVTVWESKVEKALAPIPGDTKPLNLENLKLLSSAGEDIPVYTQLEQRLSTVIDDGGCRHCLCGGPSDGRFMVGCDHCDGWFHGHCVMVSSFDNLTDWKCPKCLGESEELIDLKLDRFHEMYNVEESANADDSNSSDNQNDSPSNTLNPDLLWPPFGLFGSETAQEILGEEVSAIPDCYDIPSILESNNARQSSFGFGANVHANVFSAVSTTIHSGTGSSLSYNGVVGFGSNETTLSSSVMGLGSLQSSTSDCMLGFGSPTPFCLATGNIDPGSRSTMPTHTNTTPSLPLSLANGTGIHFGVSAGGNVVTTESDATASAMAKTIAPI